MKVTIEQEVSAQRIADVLVTAFEGGSNYWYASEGFKKNLKASEAISKGDDNYESGVPWWGLLANRIQDESINLPIYDIESVCSWDDASNWDLLGRITTASISMAIKIMAEQYPIHFSDMMNDKYDGDTADVFLQLCTMQDVVFG